MPRLIRSIRFGARILAATFWLGAAVQTHTQVPAPVDPDAHLQVSIVGGSRPFHLGEKIPLELAFSSQVPTHFRVNRANYDRSGRMEHETFRITPADGAVDPLADRRLGYIGGGLTGFDDLKPEPWTIRVNLNDWVRFAKPGEYRLDVISHRVSIANPSTPSGEAPVSVVSNPLTITIVDAPADWQRQTIDDAVAALDRGPASRQNADDMVAAIDTLRFLGTREALQAAVHWLRPDQPGNVEFYAYFAFLEAPDLNIATTVLDAALVDPDQPIDRQFMDTLRTVKLDQIPSTTPQARLDAMDGINRAVSAKLSAAVSRKHAAAQPITVMTAAMEGLGTSAAAVTPSVDLTRQIVSVFDALPINDQTQLLQSGWTRLTGSEMLPVVRRHAVLPDVAPAALRSATTRPTMQLAVLSLRRWYELDPAGARPSVVNAIADPQHRFGASDLGFLDDETLPDVDAPLLDGIRASRSGSDQAANAASLLARYGTSAVLAPIQALVDERIGRWECAIQNQMLGYLIRVDAAQARERIERALNARAGTHCFSETLTSVAAIHYDPILEPMAVRGLDDPDARTVMSSARLLTDYGGADEQGVLLDHYEKWAAQWAGHETELTPLNAERQGFDSAPGAALQIGTAYLDALLNGVTWLSDPPAIDRLRAISPLPSLQSRLDNAARFWSRTPYAISASVFENDARATVGIHLLQYNLTSTAAFDRKIAEFSPGTAFLYRDIVPSSARGKIIDAAIRASLAKHQMSVVSK